jgi:chromatin remodeling complex protein RSC6
MNAKAPVHVKKMIEAIHDLETDIYDQKDRLQKMEKKYVYLKKTAETFVKFYNKQYEKERKPSGFEIPVSLSAELCDFLDVSRETKMSRTKVTKRLIEYIAVNHLYDENRKSRVIPDEKLLRLLGENVDMENLTRFTIQKYMNTHYNR